MGRHRDPDTLGFIDWLKTKGESLGYISELEYALDRAEYFVDVVWKLRKDQTPLITFEIETRDGREIFCNTAKIYGPPSNMVSKPWNHFMVIFKGELSEGHRKALFNLINQHNVFLFEDIFGKLKNRKKLEMKLEGLKYNVSEQIKNEMQNKPLGDALLAVLKGLSEGLSDGPLGTPEVTVTFKSPNPPKGGTEFSLTTETPKGEPTFLEKLKEASKTLKPFTIESPQLKDLTIDGKPVLPKDKGKAVLTVTPQPLPPVKIVVPGTNIAFDNIFLRRIKTEGTTDYLSTEERNLPFVFDFSVDKENKANKFSFRFESSHGNVKQAFQFEELIRALTTNKNINIVEPKENKAILGFRVRESFKQSEDWYYLLSKLAYIQDKTNHVIPVPTKITQENVRDIFTLIKVIDAGEDVGSLNETSFRINKQWAKNLIDTQKKQGKISGLTISQATSYRLFNEDIPMGTSKMELPDMQFVLSLQDVEKLVEAASDKELVSLSLKPIADNQVTIRFEDWQPKKRETILPN